MIAQNRTWRPRCTQLGLPGRDAFELEGVNRIGVELTQARPLVKYQSTVVLCGGLIEMSTWNEA